MIEWLKEKFEAWIGIIVVITVILYGIAGVITGFKISYYGDYVLAGCIIGAALGIFIGIVFCVIAYGLIATVVYIANSTNTNTRFLSEIKSKLNNIEDKMSKIDEISLKLDSFKNTVSNFNSSVSIEKSQKTDSLSDNFNTVRVGNKWFSMKDSEPGKYFCPNCHAQVVESAFSCSNCNKSFVAD